jgi:hypothetical protein
MWNYIQDTVVAYCWGTWTVGGRTSIITAHYRPTSNIGYSSFYSDAAFAFAETYGPLVAYISAGDSHITEYYAAPQEYWRDRKFRGNSGFVEIRSHTYNASLEAALTIRRVGAGITGTVRGRIRIGPVDASLFVPGSRDRLFKTSDPTLLSRFSGLHTPFTGGSQSVTEVMVNRWLATATDVDTYSLKAHRGAVWQRCGFPQGKRGPDRH